MTDVQLNGQSIVTTSATTAPAAGTVETWTVTALAAGIPALASQQTYAIVDATTGASTAQQTEIVRITAAAAGATSITVTRGVDGSTPVAHAATSTFNIVTVAGWQNSRTNIPAYAQPVNPANVYDFTRGCYNYKSSNTRILEQGLSNSMAGGQTRHWVVGDSVSAGAIQGVVAPFVYDRLHAWSLCFRDQMGITGIPANGTGFVRITDGTTNDARFTQVAATCSGVNASNSYFSVTSTGTITFVADRGGSIVEWGYLDSGTASFQLGVDGVNVGSVFTTAAAGGTWKKARVTGVNVKVGSLVTLTITVIGSGLGVSGCGVWFPGGGLIIDNVAQSGSKAQGTGTAAWADPTGGPYFVFKDVSGRKRQITDAVTTNGSTTLTSATAAFTINDQGEPIDQFPDTSGTLFPPNTYMVARLSATTMQMSNAALITASGKTLNLGRDPGCIHICLGGNDIMQLGGTAAIPAMLTALTTIRNSFPNSDCIMHLENEPTPTLASSATEIAFQQAMYGLADTLDVPLYDWRDRAGTYANAFANGVMNDYQAHMTPGMYADLGAQLAWLMGGGSGSPQNWRSPVFEGDLTNKKYVDAKDYAPIVPWQQAGTLAVKTGTQRWYNDTTRTLTVTKVRAMVNTPPTGAAIILDLKKNGTTMYTTTGNRPTIAISGTSTVAVLPDIVSISPGDYLTVDIAQVGSTVAGADLLVQVTALVT